MILPLSQIAVLVLPLCKRGIEGDLLLPLLPGVGAKSKSSPALLFQRREP
jgi:hypothetical protein